MNDRKTLYLILLILVAGTAFAYWNVDTCGFVSIDDHQYVSKNHHVTTGLTAQTLQWAFTTFEAANWHPLTWLSHALDCVLYGDRPAGHHLTSLVLHLINTLLLFLVLRSATGAVWRSACVAFLFGVHPLHVESVAWISERKDVLSTMFMFLSLLSYIRFVRKKNPGYYAGSLGFFLLALLAKPMVVTLPFVMLLLDFWPLRRLEGGAVDELRSFIKKNKLLLRCAVEKAPFVALSIASCVITVIAQHAGNAIVTTTELSFIHRLANAANSYASYLSKTFWPDRLAFFYPLPQHFSAAQVISSCLLLVIVSAVAIRFARTRPYLLTGWLWFLGMLVPVIGLVQVGSQAMADRYAYVPVVGVFFAVTWLLHDIAKQHRLIKVSTISGFIGIFVILIGLTRLQCGYWKNDFTLANHALAVTKDNFFALSIKGNFLLDVGRNNDAADLFEQSLALCPYQTTPRLNLGLIFIRQRKPREAVAVFNSLLAADSNNTLANLNCGNAYGMLGDTQSAIRCYRRAIAVEPWFAAALHNLGVTYGSMKDYADCRHYLLDAVRSNPRDPESYLALGNCCLLDNAPLDAIRWYHKSIELAPGHSETYSQMAKAFDATGRGDSARIYSSLADSTAKIECNPSNH
jgi:protein O-mannosyl-transferase